MTKLSQKEFTQSYQLTAGECNAQLEMPVGLLVERLIEIATLHANSWGVGYARLVQDNQGWVLTRVTLEMERYPRMNERYSLTTWIEGYNRHFSQRNMAITGEDGQVLGYARTMWMVIDFNTRSSVDISKLSYISANALPQKPCPIEPQGRFMAVEPTRSACHTFTYTDCDFNRHVNTVRYVELLLNQFTMEHHDSHFVRRLELAFARETHYGDSAQLVIADGQEGDSRIDIMVDGQPHVRARLLFAPRG